MAEPRTLLDLGAHGGAHWIKDLDDLAQWLTDESAKWQWLSQLQESYQTWGRVNGQFNQFAHLVQEARNQGQPVHVLVADVAAQFLPGGQLIHSSSAEGEAILSVAHSIGYAEAGFAFALMKHWVSIQAMPAQLSFFHGLMRVAMPSLEPVATVEARLRAERDNFRNAARRLERELIEAEEARGRDFDRHADRYRDIVRRGWWRAARVLRSAEDGRSEALKSLDHDGRKAIASLADTEKTYKEHMELKAPVDYWTTKAAGHRNDRSRMLRMMVGYFAIALPFLIVLFSGTAAFLLKAGTVSNTVLFVAGGGLATLSGVVLWIGRLITRLYLSEHHLLHDAEERAVMTTTYLALTAERAAEETDRQIILSALFRASSDGVVKDDGAPDIGIGGLISRVVSNPK